VIDEAKELGVTVKKACEVIMLPRGRYYAWLRGRRPGEVAEADLEDEKSTPACTPTR